MSDPLPNARPHDWSVEIFHNDLLLSNIMSFLTVKELVTSCLAVNKYWNHVANNAIAGRRKSQHLFQLYRIGRPHNLSMADQTNRESHLSAADLSFVSDSFEQIETKLVDQIRSSIELDVWPTLMITFFGNFCPHSKRPERLMQYNVLRRYLPRDTKFLNVVSTAGLIGSVKRTSQVMSAGEQNKSAVVASSYEPIETQAQVGNCAGVSLLMLAEYPNVEIDVFDDRNLITLDKLSSRDDLKCLLVFATNYVGKTHDFKEFDSVNRLKSKYNNQLAIGGIITDEINYFDSNQNTSRKKSRDFYGIAFSGPKVRASSLLYNTSSPEATERKLVDFRNSLALETRNYETIGFLFICTGRGIHTEGYGNASNIEANIFRKVFPNVKLVGVFGQGEFGHNYWPGLDRHRQLLLSKELEDCEDNAHELWHFYTSVLVVISLPIK